MVSSRIFRKPGLSLLLAAALWAPARAQLDLGSPQIPQEEIDAYMEPFYRLVAAALGSDRFLPGAGPGRVLGWHAGLDGVLVPVPSGDPFQRADLSLLPLFRIGGGLSAFGATASARGLAWSDPRVGDLATFGAGFGYGLAFPAGPLALTPSLMAGWDYLSFESEYTYRYRGSPLGLADRDVPGDYTLTENMFSLGAAFALGFGSWRFQASGWYEWAAGRFRYIYFESDSDQGKTVSSAVDVPGLRGALAVFWKGFRLEAGMRSHPYFAAGWAWVR